MSYDTRHVLSPVDGRCLCRPDSWAANQNSAGCKQCNNKVAGAIGDAQKAWVLLVRGDPTRAAAKIESALERLRAMGGAQAMLRVEIADGKRRSAPAAKADAGAQELRQLLAGAMEIADHWLPDLDPEDDNETLAADVERFGEIRAAMRALDQKGKK